jgi:hypothetical protein
LSRTRAANFVAEVAGRHSDVYRLIARGTIEENIYERQSKRRIPLIRT